MARQILLVLFCMISAGAQEKETAIRHVTVVDVASGRESKDQTVRIRGSRIYSVAPSVEGDAAAGGTLDAHDAFLIPGLWDMHVHVHSTQELLLYLANGVTGIRIMSGDKDTKGFRADLAKQVPGPEIYLASAIVDGSPPVWPGSIVIRKPADARKAVDEIKAGGADFIKVYNRIPHDAYFALAEEAKAKQIPFAGHIPDEVSAQEASAAGQRSVEHLQGVGFACSSQQNRLMQDLERAEFFRQRLALEAESYRSFDAAKCRALFDEFRRNDTWQVPTLTVRRMWGRLDDSAFTRDPRREYIGKRSLDQWRERTEPQMRRWSPAQFQMARQIFSGDEKMVGAMFRAGVPLMAGTDAMNPYCFPGFSLHDELALLVEAGLTPLAALQAATLNPAKFMGKAAEFGSVEAGREADLVLLRADPLADIHNTREVEAVWIRGAYLDAAALRRMLEEVRESRGR